MNAPRSMGYVIKNAPYHAYGMLTSSWAEIWQATGELARVRSVSQGALIADIIHTQWTLGITPRDYLLMALHDRSSAERATWVGTVDMYRAQRIWNPASARETLMDKEKFSKVFAGLMDPRRFVVRDSRQAPALKKWIDDLGESVMISKPAGGQCGKGVLKHSISRGDTISVDGHPVGGGWLDSLDLPRVFEPRLENHPVLASVYAGSLNTVRVLTFRARSGSTRVFAARVRFGRWGHTDGRLAGGIAAAVDASAGTVNTPAVSGELHRVERFEEHPGTDARILGIQLPNWSEAIDLALEAASILPRARCVGWDVALTPSGPVLMEGNHNWCKILWQVPVNQGLRSEVEEMLRA